MMEPVALSAPSGAFPNAVQLEGVGRALNHVPCGLCSLICISSVGLPRNLRLKPTSLRTCVLLPILFGRSITHRYSLCERVHVLLWVTDTSMMHGGRLKRSARAVRTQCNYLGVWL